MTRRRPVLGLVGVLSGLLMGTSIRATGTAANYEEWWKPDSNREMPGSLDIRDSSGQIGILNAGGAVDTRGHAFFSAIGRNGRACVTCHQPADGMGLSVETIRRRWHDTRGADPLFAPIDGANCPNLPPGERASHSLLLDRGLFRIAMPWPPRNRDGTAVVPQFSIEVVRDPTGCNLDPTYGLRSVHPTISVFRRPRPVANLKYLLQVPLGVPPHEFLFYNDKTLLPTDPETGKVVSLQLMSDGRGITPRLQAGDAARDHLQIEQPLTDGQLNQIVAFESQIYAAQVVDQSAGPLIEAGGPPGLGPAALAGGSPAELGNNPVNRIFGTFDMWAPKSSSAAAPEADEARRRSREAIARGAELFYRKRFLINDVGMYNDKGLGNPFKRSCGSGCHNTLLMGMDLAPGFMDLGLNNLPRANTRDDLPLFKVTCEASAPVHSYLGRVIYTHDPARALITGKCTDVGASMTQQSRGLAARAPYFMNGSAASLRELVDFYDRRFNIGYTESEKTDLVAFLGVL